MNSLTPNFALEVLTPYIRLTKQEENYTLWVLIPLPMNYSVNLKNNPKLQIKERINEVVVAIDIEGPEDNPSNEWYIVPFKVELPSPEGNNFGINEQTTVEVQVLVDDPDETGTVKIKYEQAEEG